MAKLVLSALLKPFQGGVRAKVAEFPEIEATSWSVHGVVAKLREALSRRLRGVKIERSCSGDPVAPAPKEPVSEHEDVAVPIEVHADPAASGNGSLKTQA